jgi:hypothetical protein
MRLSIASGALNSGASNPKLVGRTIPLAAGGLSLGRVTFQKGVSSGGDGYLGMDVLSKMAVGFEIGRRTVTLFPRGALSPDAAVNWISEVAPAPDVPVPPVVSIPLSYDAFKRPTVNLTRGVRSYRSLVTTYLFETYFAEDPVPTNYRFTLQADCQLGPLYLPWVMSFPEPRLADGLRRAQKAAIISMDNFCSARVLFDFAGGRIYVSDTAPDVKLGDFLSHKSRAFFQIFGPQLRIAYYQYRGTALDGAARLRVKSIAGASTPQILANLRAKDDRAAEWLTNFFQKLRSSYKIVGVATDGRTRTFTMPAAPKEDQ